MFFEKVHGIGTLLEIDGFFGEQVSSRKLLPRVFPEETAANFNLLLRVKAPLCKDFSA